MSDTPTVESAPATTSTAPEPIRLNLGAGDTVIPGYTPVDIKNGKQVYPLKDYADNSVDEIYASHVLEHFPYFVSEQVIAEWVRVLKPGGAIRIAVPDMNKVMECRDTGTPEWLWRGYLSGGQTDAYDVHLAHFTEPVLRRMMTQAGLKDIVPFTSKIKDCASLPISMNLKGVKRGPLVRDKPYRNRACLVASMGELTFTGTMRCALGSIQSTGYPVTLWGGAFWDKGLTLAIEKAIADHDPQYIITLDHDSLFTKNDLERLLGHLDANTDLSAVFPVQMSRHNDRPLVFIDDKDYTTPLTVTGYGHFGMTCIRSDVFGIIPDPWFWSMPDPVTGKWDGPRCSDSDITFWRILSEHGLKVAQANDVLIGHMMLCAKWPHRHGFIYQPVQDYHVRGKPAEAEFVGSTFRGVPNIPGADGDAKRSLYLDKPDKDVANGGTDLLDNGTGPDRGQGVGDALRQPDAQPKETA